MNRKEANRSMPPSPDSLGQLFMIGFEGTEPDAALLETVRRHQPGGVILFKRNLRNPEQVLALTEALQHQTDSPPLLVAIDQEGGRVWRMPEPFTVFPAAGAVGRWGLDSVACAAARVIARELIAVGINLNFSPVLDVHTNPANPVIGDRALASDPSRVAPLARAILVGFREVGILGCGKHFPGHGDTDADSHHELPFVRHDRTRLEAVELAPYRALLADAPRALDMIMTAHVTYPALDPHRPATLSPPILQGLLRGKLGYRGVIVTDDLEMGAITGSNAPEEAALRAFRAGADLLLFCHTPAHLPSSVACLRKALDAGTLSWPRVARSLRRLAKLKRRLRARLPDEGWREILRGRIGCDEHRRVAERVAHPPADRS